MAKQNTGKAVAKSFIQAFAFYINFWSILYWQLSPDSYGGWPFPRFAWLALPYEVDNRAHQDNLAQQDNRAQQDKQAVQTQQDKQAVQDQ